MGERVIYQVISPTNREFSPAIYSHWGGEVANAVVAALKEQMSDRSFDVEYCAARLIECVIRTEGIEGASTGLGIWNTQGVLTAKDSNGDAGVILINCEDWTYKTIDSYWRPSLDGDFLERSDLREDED